MGRTTRYVGIWQGVVIRRRPQWLGKGCLKKLTKGTWLAYLSTGWPRSSSQTSCEHQNKGCVLTNGPHSKPDLLFWCQREIWNKLLRHPVCDKETCGQNITNFCRRHISMSPSGRLQILPDPVPLMVARSLFSRLMVLALRARRTMAPLCYAAKFDSFLSLDCAPGAIQGKAGFKFCQLATLVLLLLSLVQDAERSRWWRGFFSLVYQ